MSHSSNSFEWLQFLELAKELNNSAANQSSLLAEAKYRTVVGRAYYAAFNMAKQYLVEVKGEIISGNGRAHLEVRDYLSQIGGKAASASRKLNTLRDMRGKADYQLKPSRGTIKWHNESAAAINIAEEVVRIVGSLS